MSLDINTRGRLTPDLKGVIFQSPNLIKRWLRLYKDKELDILIKPIERKRSGQQNRWLWGVAYTTIKRWNLENTGERLTLDEIHAHNLTVIQGYKVTNKEVMGEEVFVVEGKRSSAWTTREFNEAKEKMQVWYAERGCIIEDPHGDSFLEDQIKGRYEN